MPAGTVERASPSAVAATPAAGESAPQRPRTMTESRKSSKPIMEKRRRARINESLGQLKTLIMDALKKDSSRHSKLEKADILEMTVKHLRNLQRLQMTAAVSVDPSFLSKYRAGFSECAGEVTRFLSTCDGVNLDTRTRLLSHLAACVTQISGANLYTPHPAQSGTRVPAACPPPPQGPRKSGSAVHFSSSSCSSSSTLDAVKPYNTAAGFQVVPTPDGHFAFLVPSAALVPLGGHNGPHTSPLVAPLVASDSVWRPW
ncbi:transcription factor HES-1-A-like [Nelusetta ayraudi]|uniref:transcription factor HES-1-A-like n=1 Tax=Nelusetta ayraudi TaxID=303726 RepID=UPI003F6EF51E